jgi:hypothetical protein
MAEDDPNGVNDDGDETPQNDDAQIFDDLTILNQEDEEDSLSEETEQGDHAQVFDDLTVLHMNEEEEGLEDVEGLGGTPRMAEGSGLENIQPGDQTEIAATLFVDNTGAAVPDPIEISTSPTEHSIPLPEIEAGSDGGEDPTPDVGQPLPDDFIELDRAADDDTPQLGSRLIQIQ